MTDDLAITATMEPLEASIALGDVGVELRVTADVGEIAGTIVLAYDATSGLVVAAQIANLTPSISIDTLFLDYRPGFSYYRDDALVNAVAWVNGPSNRSMWVAAYDRLVLVNIVRFAAPSRLALMELGEEILDLASTSDLLLVLRADGLLEVRENTQEAALIDTLEVPGGQVVAVPEVTFGYSAASVAGRGFVSVMELSATGVTTQTDFEVAHQDASGVWLEVVPLAHSITYSSTVFSPDAKAREYLVRRALPGGELVVARQVAEFDVANMKDAFKPFTWLRAARYLASGTTRANYNVVLPAPLFNLVQEFQLRDFTGVRQSQVRYDPPVITLRNADRDGAGNIIRHTDEYNADLPVPSLWLPRKFYRRIDGGHAVCHPQVGAVSRIMPEALRSEQQHSIGEDYRILTVYTAEWGSDGWGITDTSSSITLEAASDSGWLSVREVEAFRIRRTIAREPTDPEVVPDPPVSEKPPYDFIVATSSAEDKFFFNGLTTTTFEIPDGTTLAFHGTTRGVLGWGGDGNIVDMHGDPVFRVEMYRNATYGLTADDWEYLGTIDFPRESFDVYDDFDLVAETHDGYLIFRGTDGGGPATTYVVDVDDPVTLVGYYRQDGGLTFDPVGVPDKAGYVYFQGGTYLQTPYTGEASKVAETDPEYPARTVSPVYATVRKSDGRALLSTTTYRSFTYQLDSRIFVQDTIGDPTSWTVLTGTDVGLPTENSNKGVLAVGDSFLLAGMEMTPDAFLGTATNSEANDGTTTGDGSSFTVTTRTSVLEALYDRYSDGTWSRGLRVNTTPDPDSATSTDVLAPLFPPPY